MDATKNTWQEIFKEELEALSPILKSLGFYLNEDQPHLSGERFLMTRKKLVLSGIMTTDKSPVIIKAAIHQDGKNELRKEKAARDTLKELSFADDILLFPEEITFTDKNGWLIFITEYIGQKKVFVEHSLEEQFFMILRSFEAQEAFHATTFEHIKRIEKIFPMQHGQQYIKNLRQFIKTFEASGKKEITEINNKILELFIANKALIDRLSNYLVHTDFVPHNFRVRNNKLFVLDAAAVEFGNKYEGWARFLNYMIIHNPKLEQLLVTYLKQNRNKDEILSLKLMRLYKISYLIEYYIKSLGKTGGDLQKLTERRISFWHQIMSMTLEGQPINEDFISQYKNDRDSLRSSEEKERQKEFAVA